MNYVNLKSESNCGYQKRIGGFIWIDGHLIKYLGCSNFWKIRSSCCYESFLKEGIDLKKEIERNDEGRTV